MATAAANESSYECWWWILSLYAAAVAQKRTVVGGYNSLKYFKGGFRVPDRRGAPVCLVIFINHPFNMSEFVVAVAYPPCNFSACYVQSAYSDCRSCIFIRFYFGWWFVFPLNVCILGLPVINLYVFLGVLVVGYFGLLHS